MATSGPGATNLVSAIADAYMDSIPLVAITGQVKKEFIGKMAFQETDFFGMTLPIVKHSYLVMDVNEIRGSSRRRSSSPLIERIEDLLDILAKEARVPGHHQGRAAGDQREVPPPRA